MLKHLKKGVVLGLGLASMTEKKILAELRKLEKEGLLKKEELEKFGRELARLGEKERKKLEAKIKAEAKKLAKKTESKTKRIAKSGAKKGIKTVKKVVKKAAGKARKSKTKKK
ncbi:hypothetical protein D6764_02455 [Candidatus Woesearchaeota archaeon]|nr:MAG: hypothetical protein D6764_02455 [Candidatus Woesearchaeota archaeon]